MAGLEGGGGTPPFLGWMGGVPPPTVWRGFGGWGGYPPYRLEGVWPPGIQRRDEPQGLLCPVSYIHFALKGNLLRRSHVRMRTDASIVSLERESLRHVIPLHFHAF